MRPKLRFSGWSTLAIALALCVAFATVSGSKGGDAIRGPAGTVRLRLAELQPADHPTAKADYEFARLVRERSGGRIRISVYTDSVLGQEMEVLEQLRFGAIDIARVSLAAVSTYAPRLNALQMPYLYRDEDHMWKVLKGEIGRELLASVQDSGFVGLGWYDAGARSFYNSRRQLARPSSLAGLQIRVQEGGVMDDLVAALGATAKPLAFGVTYSAILHGDVDGAENNFPTYYSSRHYQVAKFYTLTEHARIPEIVIGSVMSLSELSAADRELLVQAALDSVDYQRGEWHSYEDMAIQKLREAGVSIERPADIEAWRKLALRVYAQQDAPTRALIDRIKAVK
jgi:tripartite ATP-independent periplasmic transporter solute receptor, DctP family